MTIHRLTSVAAALFLGTSAFAQQGQPGAHFIENWDLDEDGQVTLAEATQKRDEIFTMFDQDENGVLSDSEYDLFDETRRTDMDENAGGHKKGQMRGVDKAMMRDFNDTNGDGQVSRSEFLGNAEDWFSKMDRTGDGVITTDDFGRKGG